MLDAYINGTNCTPFVMILQIRIHSWKVEILTSKLNFEFHPLDSKITSSQGWK